jgi:hypothetical protein
LGADAFGGVEHSFTFVAKSSNVTPLNLKELFMASAVCGGCGNTFSYSTGLFDPEPKTGGGFLGLGRLCSVCVANKSADDRHRDLIDRAERQRLQDEKQSELSRQRVQQASQDREKQDREWIVQQQRIRENEQYELEKRRADYEFDRQTAADNAEIERQDRRREALIRSASDLLSAGMDKDALLKIVDAEAISGVDTEILRIKLKIASKIGSDSLIKSALDQLWRRIELNPDNWKRPRHEISSACDLYSSNVRAATSGGANRARTEHKKWLASWATFDKQSKRANDESKAALAREQSENSRETAICKEVDAIAANIAKVNRAITGAKELQTLGREDLACGLLRKVHEVVFPPTPVVELLLVNAARDLKDTGLLAEFAEKKRFAKAQKESKQFSFAKFQFPEGHGGNVVLLLLGALFLPWIACQVSVWILGIFGHSAAINGWPSPILFFPVINLPALVVFFITVIFKIGFFFGVGLLFLTVALPYFWLRQLDT